MLTTVVLPASALLTHEPLARVDVGAFYIHFVPVGLTILAAVAWLRRHGLLGAG